MKKSLIVTFILAFSSACCSAQLLSEFAPEYGTLNQEEIDMRKYEKDTTAEAIVLSDRGNTSFSHTENGFLICFQHNKKIKILKKAGIDFATFEIEYYVDGNESEDIEEIKGITYNQVGNKIERTPLDIKTIFDESMTKHWRIKKFSMPNVKEGSIVEILYSIKSPYFFNFRSWNYQKRIPVLYSEYVTKMIPFYSYHYVLQGKDRFDVFLSAEDSYTRTFAGLEFRDMVFKFAMKDVPAFKDEAFITCPQDFMIKQDFQLSEITQLNGAKISVVNTWPIFIKELLKHSSLGDYLKDAGSFSKKQVLTMDLASKQSLEKIRVVDQYLKSNYNWDGVQNMYADKSFKKFLETKTGNVADINLYYVALLKSAGLDAFPVILSTRNHGKIQVDYPFEHFFNYITAAVMVDGKCLLFDASEPFSAFGLLPERCINDKGLALKNDKSNVEWVQLKSPIKSSISYSIDLTPDLKSDSVCGVFNVATNGFYATHFRKSYSTGAEDLKEALLPSGLILKDTINVSSILDPNKTLNLRFLANSGMNVYENKISIAPFCNLPLATNPLKQPTRTYPIDMTYRQEKLFQTDIHIPVGYKILHVPDKIEIDNENVKIYFSTEVSEGSIVKLIGGYEFKKDVYPINSYEEIKGYFKQIVDLFNEEVVIEKSKSV